MWETSVTGWELWVDQRQNWGWRELSSEMAICHLIFVSNVWGYDHRVKWVLPSCPFGKHGQQYLAAAILMGTGCQERSCWGWQASRLLPCAALFSLGLCVCSRFCCLDRGAWTKMSGENLLGWLSTKKWSITLIIASLIDEMMLKNEIIYGKAVGSLRGKETSPASEVSFQLLLLISCGCNDWIQ